MWYRIAVYYNNNYDVIIFQQLLQDFINFGGCCALEIIEFGRFVDAFQKVIGVAVVKWL